MRCIFSRNTSHMGSISSSIILAVARRLFPHQHYVPCLRMFSLPSPLPPPPPPTHNRALKESTQMSIIRMIIKVADLGHLVQPWYGHVILDPRHLCVFCPSFRHFHARWCDFLEHRL